jgi:hypothetical protein
MFLQNGHRASPSWLISLHTILALSLLSNPVDEPVAERKAAEKTALALFRTGCRHVPKVLFCNRDISGVQALLATVLFLWETHSTEGCSTLLGVAVSMGTEIGFHRCGTQLGLQEEGEVELRRGIFWSAYILDKDMSLRIGRPSSIADEDVNVRLPATPQEGGEPMFSHRVTLSRIQSKVSRLLCSQASVKMPGVAVLGTIGMLNQELETWKVGCELMADGEIGGGRPERAQQVLRLKLVYYACLTAINRLVLILFLF